MNILIGSTRFNNETLKENETYIKNYGINGIVYGVPLKIKECYPVNAIIFVIEMNNDLNKINGIGLIRNCLSYDFRHCIYQNHNWNRYIYHGKYWVNREQLENTNKELLEKIEYALFKGKSHMKRVSGITTFTQRNYTRWKLNEKEMKRTFKKIFMEKYNYGNDCS